MLPNDTATIIVICGLLVDLIAIISFWMKIEHRLTKVETMIDSMGKLQEALIKRGFHMDLRRENGFHTKEG
jgi:hypothetical protein